MNFKNELKEYQEIIETELKKYIEKNESPEKILNQSVEYSLLAGGKRLRPILVIATYRIFKNDFEKCFPYAVAIEMIHNFSLIHDDLPAIDNDDIRHGKPTNHKKFNEYTAILAGDSMLNNAYLIISKDLISTTNNNERNHKIKAFNELTTAIDRLIAGEYVDTESEGKNISKEKLKYIHENKTGAFLRACVRIGAILADVTNKDLDKLTSYAEKIGLAFQIKDDILSEEGDEKVTGKPVGNDKYKKKCTYISEYGLSMSKEILKNTIEEAVENLKDFGEKAEFLRELAFYIKNRNK